MSNVEFDFRLYSNTPIIEPEIWSNKVKDYKDCFMVFDTGAYMTTISSTLFKDDHAVILDDEEHSEDEERFMLLGVSKEKNLLIVCHCYRENDEIIRLISARKANKQESKIYVGGKQV